MDDYSSHLWPWSQAQQYQRLFIPSLTMSSAPLHLSPPFSLSPQPRFPPPPRLRPRLAASPISLAPSSGPPLAVRAQRRTAGSSGRGRCIEEGAALQEGCKAGGFCPLGVALNSGDSHPHFPIMDSQQPAGEDWGRSPLLPFEVSAWNSSSSAPKNPSMTGSFRCREPGNGERRDLGSAFSFLSWFPASFFFRYILYWLIHDCICESA